MEDTEEKPFPFFNLPAEIRNMIFKHLLVSCRGCLWVTARWEEPYYYRYTDEGYKDYKDGQKTPINWDFDEELSEEVLSEIELISDASRHPLNGPYRAFHKCHADSMPSEYFTPQLLTVSKQMYHEAGSFFYSNQEFAFETWTDFHLFLEKADRTHASKTRHVRLPISLPGIPGDPKDRAGSEDETITTFPVIRPWYGWDSYQDSYSSLLSALPALSTLTLILPEHLTVLDLTMAKPNEKLPKNLVLRMQSLFSRKLDHRDDSSALDRETVEILILQFWKLQGRIYESKEVQEYSGALSGPRKMERAWDWPFWERSPHWCVDDMLTVDLDKVLGIKKDYGSQGEKFGQSQASEN